MLKELRKRLKAKPASFFTFPRSDYAKMEMRFLDKMIENKKAESHFKIAKEANERLLTATKNKESKDGQVRPDA
jgi:hypothetical protein